MKRTLCGILAVIIVCASVFFCGCGKNKKVTVSINPLTLSPAELADLDKFAEDNGYLSAKMNQRKGVIEVVLDDTEHDKLTYSLGVSVIRNVYSLIDSDEYPYIKDIKRNDIFSDMTVLVNKTAFEKAGKANEIMDLIGENCLLYLSYEDLKEKDKVCSVKIADKKSGDVLSEKTYSVKDIAD